MDDRKGTIPPGEFFGEKPPASRRVEDEETATAFEWTPPPPPPPTRAGEVPGGAFFRAAPPPRENVLARWAARPMKHGAIAFLVGFTGTLVLAANILTQIVLGAPVFEELWKFGLALMLVAALRVDLGVLRLVIALVPGAGFGVMEHFLTYPDEPVEILVNRVVFHSGSTALSMAVYHAIAPVWDPRVRWAATIPASVVHWANNFGAVLLGFASLFAEAQANLLGFGFTSTLAVLAHVLAWLTLAAQRRVRGLVLRVWVKHAPADLSG